MDESEERIQRALNEAKRRELKEKYGADFGGSNLPPDLETEWLRYIEEFELQYQNAGQVTIRAFIGNPDIKPLAAVPHDRLEAELDALLDLMDSCNVIVHFDREISPEEAYRFLTVELLNEETDDIHIEGMRHNFIYSEFHPGDESDASAGDGAL